MTSVDRHQNKGVMTYLDRNWMRKCFRERAQVWRQHAWSAALWLAQFLSVVWSQCNDATLLACLSTSVVSAVVWSLSYKLWITVMVVLAFIWHTNTSSSSSSGGGGTGSSESNGSALDVSCQVCVQDDVPHMDVTLCNGVRKFQWMTPPLTSWSPATVLKLRKFIASVIVREQVPGACHTEFVRNAELTARARVDLFRRLSWQFGDLCTPDVSLGLWFRFLRNQCKQKTASTATTAVSGNDSDECFDSFDEPQLHLFTPQLSYHSKWDPYHSLHDLLVKVVLKIVPEQERSERVMDLSLSRDKFANMVQSTTEFYSQWTPLAAKVSRPPLFKRGGSDSDTKVPDDNVSVTTAPAGVAIPIPGFRIPQPMPSVAQILQEAVLQSRPQEQEQESPQEQEQ